MHGASLFNILKYQGYPVTGISHVGDFGSPMGQVVSEILLMDLPFVRKIKEGKEGNIEFLIIFFFNFVFFSE